MSEKTLAVKYRPQTFLDVVEQENIIKILKSQLDTNTIKNAYLFAGSSGTGKTTIARIFANEINKYKGMPIEVDAASNSSVENVRKLITDSGFKAMDAEYRIYILDECHSFSLTAFQAFLKTLEEPSAKSIFIFCTTNPEKIPKTILNRVQRYDFQRISHKAIVKRLIQIMEMENDGLQRSEWFDGLDVFEYEQDAIEYIAKIAEGGLRDAITLMDKCISYSNTINMNTVINALGVTNYDDFVLLTKKILLRESIEVIKVVEKIHSSGIDLKQFVKMLGLFVLDLIIYELTNSFDYIKIPNMYEEDLKKLFKICNHDDIVYLLKKLNELSTNIKWENSPKSLILSTLILMCEE